MVAVSVSDIDSYLEQRKPYKWQSESSTKGVNLGNIGPMIIYGLLLMKRLWRVPFIGFIYLWVSYAMEVLDGWVERDIR